MAYKVDPDFDLSLLWTDLGKSWFEPVKDLLSKVHLVHQIVITMMMPYSSSKKKKKMKMKTDRDAVVFLLLVLVENASNYRN